MKLVKLAFGSDDLFALLAARPEWGRFFAVGDQVTVVLDGVAYQVGNEGGSPVAIPAAVTTDGHGPGGAQRDAGAHTDRDGRQPAPPPPPPPLPPTRTPAAAPAEPGPLERFWQWLAGLLGVR